jgi:folate-binding protein YgfZ
VIATTEYELLTDDAGVVERPGRAVLLLEGGEAAEFLQGQVTNDVEALEPGQGCYAALLDHKGKLRADMRVLRLGAESLQVDGEAIARAVLRHNFETYSLGRDVRARDLSDERTVSSVIGPAARERLGIDLPEAEHSFVEGELGLYVATDLGVDLIGTVPDLPAVSEDAAECRRVESGRPRLGLDMGSSTIPQEAGLNERAVSFTKGCYVGQETVARLHYKGKPNRHLRGLRLSEPASHGDEILLGDKQVGTVGSACVSPTHGPIALALVRREAAVGDEVEVAGSPAAVADLPFV